MEKRKGGLYREIQRKMPNQFAKGNSRKELYIKKLQRIIICENRRDIIEKNANDIQRATIREN